VKWRHITHGYPDRIEGLKRLKAHELLEVEERPTESDLKQAYRTKVKAYHPDRVDPFLRPHAQEILKLINTAYAALVTRCRR
jgi:curved DNA-binding protein CbpA